MVMAHERSQPAAQQEAYHRCDNSALSAFRVVYIILQGLRGRTLLILHSGYSKAEGGTQPNGEEFS